MKSGKKRLGTVAILLFWLIMMGWLLRREVLIPTLQPGQVAITSEEPREAWMGVFLNSARNEEGHTVESQQVGRVHFASRPETREGLAGAALELDAEVHLNLLSKATDLYLEGSVWRPRDVPRAVFEFEVRSADYDFQVAGEVAEGMLRAQVTSVGETLPLEMPVDDGVLFGSGMGTALQFPVLEVGEEYRLESFDPLTLSKGTAKVRCVAKEVLSLREGPVETSRLEVEMSGIRSLAWVDEFGEVVRAETPVGLVLERLPPSDGSAEVDLAAASGSAGEDLLGLTAIEPTGERPFRGARDMVFAVSGLEGIDLPLDRVQQSLGEGKLRISTPPEPVAVGAGTVEGYLASDAFVQSDHPNIRQQARSIVGDEEDPWQQALKIHEWVFVRLEKEAVVSVPSALEVLARRRGDCNEHTVLFTALARSIGLPTRIAIGLVWSDDLGGFYYHAWPEVHLSEGWVWLDPTLGQPRADATHIKLLNGGIETWPQILPFLGRLEIDVLSIE